MIEKTIRLNNLYDIYKELLSDSEKDYFELYYISNLSLSEISDSEGITRSAISKKLNRIEEKLNNYEERLCLFEKNKKLEKIMNCCKDGTIKKMLEDL